MSSARRAGQVAGASAGARRLAKGKAVADGESSGKRKSVGGHPCTNQEASVKDQENYSFFLRILKSLNERQKNALWQLGFGGLLDFDVTSVPRTLAYWLLEHFDHLRCSLMLPNDVELEVDTKDVELVYGFPNGGIKTHWQNIIAHYIRQNTLLTDYIYRTSIKN
ncbi:hypothetical protein SASPL_102847 [Salvia splendens]|uniref:Uncharacterized protein n=1 Tax=Salvia splendens TaxID=180675 RepID=A0A8X8YSN7_SALSN|nr:hypothetical protein SASPL_102847 [Salvia splendens]